MLASNFSQKDRWIIVWSDQADACEHVVAGRPTKSCVKRAVGKYGKHFVDDATEHESDDSDDDVEDPNERVERAEEDDAVSLKSISSHICF